MPFAESAHVDTFARDNLPAEADWPMLDFSLPDVQYPERLNAAAELLDRTIERFGPDRVAFRTPDGQHWGVPGGEDDIWTYGELQHRVDQVARLLTEDYGLVPGNRVLLRIPNNPWTAIVWLAVVKAGGIVVTTMVAWRHFEVEKIIRKVKPTLAVVDHRFLSEFRIAAPDLTTIVIGGREDSLLKASGEKEGNFPAVDTAADDVALLGPTSGTTGEPKVTMHFHRDVLAIADTFAKHILKIQPDDVIAGSPPLAFTFGLGGLVIFPLRFGASTLIIEQAKPGTLADAIDEKGVTVLFTAPTGYRTMLRQGRADSLRKLRVAVSAGEHLPKTTFEEVEREAGLRLIDGIGSTEMLHVFISAVAEEVVPGATGKAIPGFRATILDDDGNEVPDGTPGHLAIVGPTGCRYLDDERQRRYVKHGWNITGDTYIRDENGYFYYQARSDDMIIASGYNVGAPEVEAAIDSHPSVVESVVVGRPDPEKGAIVNAFIVLYPGVPEDDTTRESIKEVVRERLATFKIPRRIDFVESLPRNPSGKLLRFPLRQRAEQEAAAEEAAKKG